MSEDSNSQHLQKFQGLIWKLVPDTSNFQIGLEIRQDTSLEVQYFVFSLNDLSCREIKVVDIDWWTNLAGIYGSRLMLYQHKDQQNPGPGLFRIFNFNKAIFEEEITDASITSIDNGLVELKVLNEDSSEKIQIDLTNGQTESEISTLFPELYLDDQVVFRTVVDFLDKKMKVQAVKGIEYLEYEGSIIVVFYQNVDAKYQRTLVIIKNSEISWSQLLDSQMEGISSESFFLMGNRLIFVSNRNALGVYEL